MHNRSILMDTESIRSTIHHIDRQLSKIKLVKSNKPAADHLFELRNNLLLTYKPSPEVDWTFKNKHLLSFFDKEVQWVNIN